VQPHTTQASLGHRIGWAAAAHHGFTLGWSGAAEEDRLRWTTMCGWAICPSPQNTNSANFLQNKALSCPEPYLASFFFKYYQKPEDKVAS